MSTKSKLKSPIIFIVCGKSPLKSYGGGYSTFALNLAKVLKSFGYKIFVVAIGEKNQRIETPYGTLLLFKTFYFDYYTTALPSLPLSSYIFSRGIKKIVEEENCERFIVWGIGPWGFVGSILKNEYKDNMYFINNYFTTLKHEWYGALQALDVKDYGIFVKLKFFFLYHTIVAFLSQLEKIIIFKADLIITNYRSTEIILQKQFGISQSKFTRTTFLTEVYSRQAQEHKKNNIDLPKRYLLYLSRHDPRKGINFLLHAVDILAKKGIHIPLVIAGTGQMIEANKKLAKKLNISDIVHFVGFVNDPTEIMKNAEVFCFPTVEEGAGALIINEAMSLGLPIVATACDGIVEDIENGKSGILVPVKDPSSFAQAIEQLIENPQYAKMLGNNAKKRYKQLFTYARMREDIKQILRKYL